MLLAKIKGKKLSDSQIKQLLNSNVTDFINGFNGGKRRIHSCHSIKARP